MSTRNLTIGIVVVCAVVVGAYLATRQPEQRPDNQDQASINRATEQREERQAPEVEFSGEEGERVTLVNGRLELDKATFNGALANYYNVELPSGKTVYFFVLRDREGVYRAAANACQVCFDARMGFRQEGDYMVCNTCGNRYPLEKIATEKGGCNPGPINPNLEVQDRKVIIEQVDLEDVAWFF